MLMQKGANINETITTGQRNNPKKEIQYKFFPRHFNKNITEKTITLFQGLVQNDWLGLTYLAMQQIQNSDNEMMAYAKAIEVAFELQKFQFAKRLIEKQAGTGPLLERVKNNRNLILALICNCQNDEKNLIVCQKILDLLMTAGLNVTQIDDHGCTVLHYASKLHNLSMLKYLCRKITDHEIETLIQKEDNMGRTPLMSSFWLKKSSLLEIVDYLIQIGAHVDVKAVVLILFCFGNLEKLNANYCRPTKLPYVISIWVYEPCTNIKF